MTSVKPSSQERIAEAAVVVVARDGFDVLSVRTVARQAGLSAGAVQHHCPTRTDLLAAAFDRTVQTIVQRVSSVSATGALDVALSRLLREALPLDDVRRQECAVWTALSAAAAQHPGLAARHRAALDEFLDAVGDLIAAARTEGTIPTEVRPRAAAAVLLAVLDGLTLHGVAGSRSPRALTAVLDRTIALVLHRP